MAGQERNRKRIAGGLLALTLVGTGCSSVASMKYVAFPTQGQDPAKQAQDIQDCEAVAKGHKQDPATAALLGGLGQGALVGAASAAGGAILGAIVGNAGKGAQAGLIGLGVGALLGVVEGVAEANRRYEAIYRACLQARGYTTGG